MKKKRKIFLGIGFFLWILPLPVVGMTKECKKAFSKQKKVKEVDFPNELKGTVVDKDPSQSTVLIWDKKDQMTRLFKVGEEVYEGYKLCWIGRKKMIVLRMEILGLVTLDEDEDELPIVHPRFKKPIVRSKRNRFRRSYRGSAYKISHFKRKELQEWLQKPLAEKGVQFSPYFRHGRPMGMNVTNLQEDSFLHKLGLRKGDVLMDVNGKNALAPGYTVKSFQNSMRYRNLRMKIVREGREQVLDYSLR